MANEEKRVWGIHTTDDNLFLTQNVIAIGWKEFGDCSKLEPTRDAYKSHYLKVYPTAKKGAIATSAGMLYRFACEMKVGDFIVFPSKMDRKINIGMLLWMHWEIPSTFCLPAETSLTPVSPSICFRK